MPNSRRLEGLELLRQVGAPVPNWQIVKSLEDVQRLNLPKVDYGWTIRTCRRDGRREMGLFYLNYSDPVAVTRVLEDRLAKVGPEFYIVYPSWRFRFSCNVLLHEHSVCLEGKYGSQKDLSIGKSRPDFGLKIPFFTVSKMSTYLGEPSPEVLRWLGSILVVCKRIPLDAFYAEVALIHTETLMFYELFPVGDRA